MPEKSAIGWSNWHTGTDGAHCRRNFKISEFSGFMGRCMWRDATVHSLLRLLKNMPVFPLHARTHTCTRARTHTYYISVLIDFGETQFENHAVFFSQTPWHLVPLRFMYSPQYLFLEYFLSIWLPQYDKRSFRTVQNKRQKSVMKGRRV